MFARDLAPVGHFSSQKPALGKRPEMKLAHGIQYRDNNEIDRLILDPCSWKVKDRTEKKRKLNHAERKRVLEKEIRLLQSGVETIKTRGLSPQLILQRDSILRPKFEEQTRLLYAIQTQQLHIAKMQSALSRCLVDQQFFPLYSRITLSNDWNERRSTLLSMREEKLRTALDFAMALSPDNTLFSENKFENAQGDMCCVRYETVQFNGVSSLQEVFDAVSFYKTNMEFIISEQLGHTTLRDDYDAVGSRAYNTRILSTNESGITTEVNVVSFRHMFSEDDDGYDGEPCGIITVNSVDEDERYPYISSDRVRQDVSGAVVLTACRKPVMYTGSKVADVRASEIASEGELVVTMRHAVFVKIRRPEFPLSERAYEQLLEENFQWCDLMFKTVREIVYTQPWQPN